MFKFKPEHLEKYKGVTPKWGPVGAVTYKRTYSRPIYENGKIVRREDWLDTCVRVIEGSMNLVPEDITATEEWALQALDMMFNMAWIPSGRGMWMLGTEYSSKRGGDALNNCWWVNAEPTSYEDLPMFKGTYVYSGPVKPMPSFPYAFAADRLMLGGGVGFGVGREYIDKFEVVKNKVSLGIYVNKSHTDVPRIKSDAEFEAMKKHLLHIRPENAITVDDSREGWVCAIREVIDAHWHGTQAELNFDISNIRGYGEDIKGFGGTSSGIVPLIIGLMNINDVLDNRVSKKLRSTDALDMINIIGKIVVSGNVRRSAILALGDTEDSDYVNAKNYTLVNPILELDENGYPVWEQVNGSFSQKKKPYEQCVQELGKEKADELFDLAWKQHSFRWASNNSVYVHEMFDDFHFISAGIIANGEPGYINKDLIKHYGRLKDGYQKDIDKNATGVNPCFRGDMRLLTTEGYKTFAELCDKEVNIVNKDGNVSKSKVWCSGKKPVVQIKFQKRDSIVSTPDHRFLLNTGEECAAESLKGKRLMPYLKESVNFDTNYVIMGVCQGDGTMNKLDDPKARNGIEVNVGEKDGDIWELLGKPEFYSDGRKVYHTDTFLLMKELGFSSKPLPQREFPTTYDSWSDKQKLSFLRGCYSANGSVLKVGRITYKTTCAKFANKLKDELLEFGVNAYITTNESKVHEFYNGSYTMKESYDVNIANFAGRHWFYNNIGFVQRYKMEKLKVALIDQSPMVVDVKQLSKEVDVYDFTEPITHWGVVEGFVAHNCGEITLESNEPCNLVEVVPQRCLELGYNVLDAIRIATQYAYRITFAKYIWPQTQRVIDNNRRIGVSITGCQDYLLSKYGHYALKEFENGDITKPIFHEDILAELDHWYQYVKIINRGHAIALGSNPSIKLTTVKPSGTVAKLPGVSSGIHFHYSPYLIQRIRFHDTDPNLRVLEACGLPIEKAIKEPNTTVVEFPVKAANAEHSNFKCASDVSLEEQFANQFLYAYAWADNAVSATLTFQQNETDKIEPLLKAYKNRIKSTSLLPYSGHGYVQAPWEPISKEEYDRRVSQMRLPVEEAYKYILLVDSGEILEEDCAGGSCPLR